MIALFSGDRKKIQNTSAFFVIFWVGMILMFEPALAYAVSNDSNGVSDSLSVQDVAVPPQAAPSIDKVTAPDSAKIAPANLTNSGSGDLPPIPIAKSQNENLTSVYQKTFIISAYYSPLQGQNKYVTGSFDGDVRLNGEGVHSADGSIVYPGMVAAPKGYLFGTKMKIPGIGIVAVHDRGGAIVHAGQKNQAYDRLDVWMGYGDAGLKRALSWGRRTVDVTVYGVNPDLKEEVYLEGYNEAEKYVQNTLSDDQASEFPNDLNTQSSGSDVADLQTSLQTLQYYKGGVTKTFDVATQAALVKFQIDAGIVDADTDFGAGYFGPQTRKALQDALGAYRQQLKENLPQANLGRDDRGIEVKKLQEALKRMGYDVEVNGIYDLKTVDAIFQFQKDNQIISSSNETGAGYFGPKTKEIMADRLGQLVLSSKTETVVTKNVFARNLQLGDQGDDVTTLQQELAKLHLLGIDANGVYGNVTEHAVFKFQQSQQLVGDQKSTGAGILGPLTRARMNALIGQREQTLKLISTQQPAKKEDQVAVVKSSQ